jgi:glutamyl-tRNA reductase
MSRLLVEKLLLEPTEQLKALPDEETQMAYTEAVNRLFRLRADDPQEPPAAITPAARRSK